MLHLTPSSAGAGQNKVRPESYSMGMLKTFFSLGEAKPLTYPSLCVCTTFYVLQVCGQRGHKAGFVGAVYVDCPNKPCYLCKQPGHTTATCPHSMTLNAAAPPAAAAGSRGSTASPMQLLLRREQVRQQAVAATPVLTQCCCCAVRCIANFNALRSSCQP
jgi:hypothetical protein